MVFLLALFVAASQKGAISVRSATPGARVFLDDKLAGQAPIVLRNVSAGKHSVRVQRLGYLQQDEEVEVIAGKTADVEVDLLPVAGILKVNCKERGAELWVDGKRIGGLPYEGEISVGKRSVEIRKDGFQTYRQTLQVGAGNDYKISAVLQRSVGDDLPLVAVAPRKKKSTGSDELPLEAPALVAPSRDKPLGVQAPLPTEAVAEPSHPIYKEWWFWTAAGVVVAAAIVIPVAVVESQPGGPPLVGRFSL